MAVCCRPHFAILSNITFKAHYEVIWGHNTQDLGMTFCLFQTSLKASTYPRTPHRVYGSARNWTRPSQLRTLQSRARAATPRPFVRAALTPATTPASARLAISAEDWRGTATVSSILKREPHVANLAN